MKNLITNLPLRRKFLAMGVVAIMMLMLPFSLLLRSDLARLASARAELGGLQPSLLAIELVHVTQQHRGLAAIALGGGSAASAGREANQGEVDKALARLLESVRGTGDATLAAAGAKIAEEWQSLAAAVGGASLDTSQSARRHTALIARQLDLLQDLTHASGLVLVPDASTYFLQAAVLSRLPALTEHFGQARGLGASLLSKRSGTDAEKATIAMLGARVTQSFNEARKFLDLSVKGDAAAQASIGSAIESAAAAAREGIKMMDEQVVRAERLEFPAERYYELCTQAIEAQFQLIGAAGKALEASLKREIDHAQGQMLAVVGVCGALALFGAWLMWFIARVSVQSISSALRMTEAVAAGDLTTSVLAAGRDEVGRLLKALAGMQDGLAAVVGSVRLNAESVATASAQIAQGNQDLSQRTEEQASALQQTAASMERLGATVTENAAHAAQANELARGASKVATEGGAVVNEVVETMKSIHDSSRRIADIIGVIDGIAFQTNILALNAAVEAARAGEQGRGFAVVASEVRSLARRSADAAKEIKTLITASVEEVERGSSLVTRAGATIAQAVEATQRVTQIMGDISSASAEQSTGVAEVGTAVNQMDQTTQQNAALVEQSAAAAESLKQQARQLVDAVAVFRLASDGRQPCAQVGGPPDIGAKSLRRDGAASSGAHRRSDRRAPGAGDAAQAGSAERPAARGVADDSQAWETF